MSGPDKTGRLIHLNGAPGVGKLTIARRLALHLNARVLDNHTIYNPAFALAEFKSAQFYDIVRAVRATIYDQILRSPENESIILTDAYFSDSAWAVESWETLEHLAKMRGGPFFTFALTCDALEHGRRITSEDRLPYGKVMDESYVDRASARILLDRRAALSAHLDVTRLSAEESAAILARWIESDPPTH